MENATDIIMPRPLLPNEPLEEAVYCAECDVFKQEVIGDKCGTCMGHAIPNCGTPMKCSYYKNAQRIVSVLVFLKGSGLSIYNRAMVKDFTKEIDPGLLTSFLQAISSFGMELTNEEISTIEFQKMKIVFCRGKNINGALIIRGEFDNEAKQVFSNFINKVEKSYPDYLSGSLVGKCLPEEEIDGLCFDSLKEYAKGKMYPVSEGIVEESCKVGCKGC